VFFERDDYALYLDWLALAADRAHVAIWCYCLMPNHEHTGLYYFAPSFMFPSDLEQGLNLDRWYFDHKSTMFAILLVCQLLAQGSRYALMGEAAYQWSLVVWIGFAVFVVALAAAVFARGFRRNVTLLVVLIAPYLEEGIRHLSR
jgi:hypothetical protein